MTYTVDDELLTEIYDLLYNLGLTATRTHFFHASFAVYLAVQDPVRLLLVTKWLYPDVAKHYATNWKAVERNIRTAVTVVWRQNPRGLSQLAGYELQKKPTPTQFLNILANAIADDQAA